MSEMTDRVMRAIAENMPSPYEQDIVWRTGDGGEAEFDLAEATKYEGWQEVARAAIEAMRDAQPTDEMMSAMWSLSYANTRESFQACWQSMISAALKE